LKKTFIVAELSANHNHDFDVAIRTIKAAREAGADAIKLQTYTPDTMTIDCDNEYFQIRQGTLWDGVTLYELYKKAYTPWEWHEKLFEYANSIGITIFSTPFDKTAVDFLEELENPIYKIASFEITDIPLIEYAASKMKPMVISTGIATLDEISDAVEACKNSSNNDITLLKCTSSYPAPLEEANLLTIPDMRDRFKVKVGLSDHTMCNITALGAVALGAEIIEKHFILDRNLGGPDAPFSMEPDEIAQMVEQIRMIEKALGTVSYDLSDKMRKNRKFSRSLFAVKDIQAGDVFTEDNVRSIRPGDGIGPKYIKNIWGEKSKRFIGYGNPVLINDCYQLDNNDMCNVVFQTKK
jgi:pseudaminic acid synthase